MAQVEPVDPFHGTEQNLRFSLTMYWDTNTLEWVKGTQGSGGGGGGDASAANQVTGNTSLSSIDGKVATAAKQDTAQTSFGATTDAEATGDGSIIAILKRLRTLLSGTLTVASHAVTNAGTFAVQVAPSTSDGSSIFMAADVDGSTALTNSAQAIKASAGILTSYYVYNPNAVAVWVLFYNTAAGSVTVGTTNPYHMIVVPATSAANLSYADPIKFTNAGWSVAASTSGTTSAAPSTALSASFGYR